LWFEASQDKIVHETLSQKNPSQKRAGGGSQGSNPSTTKKKKKKKKSTLGIGSPCIAQAGLKLKISFLSLPSARITGVATIPGWEIFK
jgi:hypothetical protein